VTFEEWLKDRPYAHQVPPMTKLWMEDAWQAALRRAAEICREQIVNRPSDTPANYFDGGCETCAKAIEADRG
jgi:hypothetical protein